MTNVTRMRHVLPLPSDVVVATNALDTALIKAIDAAKEAGRASGPARRHPARACPCRDPQNGGLKVDLCLEYATAVVTGAVLFDQLNKVNVN